MRLFTLKAAFLCTLLSWPAAVAVAQSEHNPVAREPRSSADQSSLGVIIKFRKDAGTSSLMKLASASDRVAALAKRQGLALAFKREISTAMLAASVDLQDSTPESALARLRANPEIEHVSVDRQRYAHATNPNDTLFGGQWYLGNTEVSAVNAINAWDREKGFNGVVVAVLDTGVLYNHPDLGRGDQGGKLLPGFDFVSSTERGNDNDGRDSDPSDPGDFVLDSERSNPMLANCDVTNSSWHGTRVAGMIGALTDNSTGVAGLSWNSFILPVRVLGKCGGNDSDILAGMRWAAGLPVPGAPANPTPARILNMSLGSSSACEASYEDVIEELTARRVLVVISAGNEGTMVSSPANCPGVAAIAAIRHAGSKVGFSNLGPEVTVAAPGGNCVNINGGPCLFSLDTTSNAGSTAPGAHIYTDQINSNLGTSFSAPIVSGIAALMVARNGNLSTSQMLGRLREGARPFPTSVADDPNLPTCHVPVNRQDFQLAQCLCTTLTCGAGMVDASNAVTAAERPIAAVALPGGVSAGQPVALNASGSAAACNGSLSSFAWTVVSPAANPPAITNADSANASVLAPATGSITLRLTVTDNQNRIDTADVVIEPDRAQTSAPATAGSTPCVAAVTSGPTPGSSTPNPPNPNPPGNGGGSRGGGGGWMDLATLLLAALALGFAAARRRRVRIDRCN